MGKNEQAKDATPVLYDFVKYRSSEPSLYLAAWLVTDAWQTEKWWREQKRHKLRQWGLNLIDTKIYETAYSARHHKMTSILEAGVNASLGGLATVATSAATTTTAGVATLPAFVAIAAGSYVVQKTNSVLFGVFRNQYRRNRNWEKTIESDQKKEAENDKKIEESKNKVSRGFHLLKKEIDKGMEDLSGLKSQNQTPLSSLTIDASDAILRAFDHFSRAQSTRRELRRLKADLKSGKASMLSRSYQTNFLDAFSRFTHELKRTQNYLLPCFDLSVMILSEYHRLSQLKDGLIRNFTKWAAKYLRDGDHTYCRSVLGSVWNKDPFTGKFLGRPEESLMKVLSQSRCCYQQEGSSRAPRLRRKIAEKRFKLPDLSIKEFDNSFASVDVQALIENVSFVAFLVCEDLAGEKSDAEKKIREDMKEIFDRYDNPNLAKRVSHSIRNSWNRKTMADRLYTFIAIPAEFLTATATGTLTRTFGIAKGVYGMNELSAKFLNEFGGIGVSLGEGLGKIGGDEALKGALGAMTKDMPKEMATAFAQIADLEAKGTDHAELLNELKGGKSNNDISTVRKEAKIASNALFKKAAYHLVAAKAAHDAVALEIATSKPTNMMSCTVVFERARLLVTYLYQLRKALLFIEQALKVTLLITANVLRWQKQANALWTYIDKQDFDLV